MTGAELLRHNAKRISEMSEAELDAVAGGIPSQLVCARTKEILEG